MKKHKIGWRIGRRMSGDRLDGRQWHEFPELVKRENTSE
jgi:hypothetical protein